METKKTQLGLLKAGLILYTALLAVYTVVAINREGWTLLQIFTANLSSLGWNGQFNLDFSAYLLLSGVWILWRNRFSGTSVVVALVATVVGFLFFSLYLLYLLRAEKGSIQRVLLGDR